MDQTEKMQFIQKKPDFSSPISQAISKYWVVECLLHPDRLLISALCEIVLMKENEADLTESIIGFYSLHSKLEEILNWRISKEINQTREQSTLFRGSSPVMKFFQYLFKTHGQQYLKFLVEPLVLSIKSRNWESPDVLQTTIQLLEILEIFVNQFVSNLNQCPLIFKILLAHMRKEAATQFSSQTLGTSIVGGFIFLRFICPAIVTPTAYNILKGEVITGPMQKALTEATRILQSLANGTEFPTNSAMNKPENVRQLLNQFIKKNSNSIRDTLNNIADEKYLKERKLVEKGPYIRKSTSHENVTHLTKVEAKAFSDPTGEGDKYISHITLIISQFKDEIKKYFEKELPNEGISRFEKLFSTMEPEKPKRTKSKELDNKKENRLSPEKFSRKKLSKTLSHSESTKNSTQDPVSLKENILQRIEEYEQQLKKQHLAQIQQLEEQVKQLKKKNKELKRDRKLLKSKLKREKEKKLQSSKEKSSSNSSKQKAPKPQLAVSQANEPSSSDDLSSKEDSSESSDDEVISRSRSTSLMNKSYHYS